MTAIHLQCDYSRTKLIQIKESADPAAIYMSLTYRCGKRNNNPLSVVLLDLEQGHALIAI